MTTTSDHVDTSVDDPDLGVQERTVGNNVDYAGSRIPDRFHRYVKSLRFIRLAIMGLRVPLRFTLELAPAALAEHRAARQAG
ncbi:hypothetical protein [Mycobacteroides abscessus]|uniref:hypothetical protein n=1 Tax=Mycobacteroides abscessus TaxID=36809 RepID=UPI000E678A5C|nr:hypothetical protein [Mycobacteroides abscessus]RIU10272.1 hypothetical protein D2E97_15560 [Mycobacteroides abscessus]